MSRAIDAEIARLARRQHGVWSLAQATAAGATRSMITTRLQRGEWLRLDTAVFAHLASEPTWRRTVMAAVLAEPWAAASHSTAASLHGLPGFGPGNVHVVVPPGANARGELSVAHRACDTSVVRVDGIPTTTLAHTFVDLSQTASDTKVFEALQTAAIRHPTLIGEIQDIYLRLAPRGGRNLGPLRVMLDELVEAPVAESVLELRLQEILSAPGIPPVEWQAPFPGRVDGPQRVDGLIRAWSMVVEGDGRSWHTRVDDFERDRRRDAEAAAAGLLPLRYTWAAITNRPDWVRQTVMAAGAHRSPLLIPT